MVDKEGEKQMGNSNWVDISKHDTVLVIASAIILTFLGFLGWNMVH
jgi:hypothetical protein